MASTSQVTFRAVPGGRLRGDRALQVTFDEDTLVVELDELDIAPELVAELNHMHLFVIGSGLWVSGPTQPADSSLAPPPTTAMFALVEPEDLPAGAVCLSVEGPNRFVWLIRRGLMSGRLASELTAMCARFVQDQTWIHNRGGLPQPVAS